MDPIKRLISHSLQNKQRIIALSARIYLAEGITKQLILKLLAQFPALQNSSDRSICIQRVAIFLKSLNMLIDYIQSEEVVSVSQVSFMDKKDQDCFSDEIESYLDEGMRRYLDDDENFFTHIKDIVLLLNDEIEAFKCTWTYRNTVEAKLLLALYLMGKSSSDKKSYSPECKLKSRFFLKNHLQDYILDRLLLIGEPDIFKDFIIFLQENGFNLNRQNLPDKSPVIPQNIGKAHCQDEYLGNTLAHTLVANEEVKRLTILVEESIKGNVIINWNAVDHEGKSIFALMLRVYNEKIIALAEVLFDNGLVDSNLADNHGITPLHSCAYLGHKSLFHKIANKNNVHYKDINGLTPLEILLLPEASTEIHIISHLCSLMPTRDVKAIHDRCSDIGVKACSKVDEIILKHSKQLIAHSNLFKVSHKEIVAAGKPLANKALLTELINVHEEYLKTQNETCCVLVNVETEKPFSEEELQKLKQNVQRLLSGKSIVEVCNENVALLKAEVLSEEKFELQILKITQRNSKTEILQKRKSLTTNYFITQGENKRTKSEDILFQTKDENIERKTPSHP